MTEDREFEKEMQLNLEAEEATEEEMERRRAWRLEDMKAKWGDE